METLTLCPVCKNSNFNSFLQVKDQVVSRETFSIDTCLSCGFRFTNPRPSETEIGRYYESEDYIYHSNKKKGVFLSVYHIARDFAINQKIKVINNLVDAQKPKHILDFGCGTGEFLSACQKAGWSSKGIETSSTARNFAKTNFQLDVEDLPSFFKLKENSFDVITLWHVLEHVHRLEETIKTLKFVLKNEGTILIAVPNCSSKDAKYYGRNWAAFDPPRHLSHFTPSDMKKLFQSQGMEIKRLHRMPLDAFYVSLLSEKFKTGKMNLIGGLMQGFLSNLNSLMNPGQCSSITYEIQRKK